VEGEETQRERVCEAVSFAKELEPVTASYIYRLKGFGGRHGSEVEHLFRSTPEGSRLRSLLIGFSRSGKPPPFLYFFRAKAFRESSPEAVNFYLRWQHHSSIEGC